MTSSNRKPTAPRAPKSKPYDATPLWAEAGVYSLTGFSALLNGYAATHHASTAGGSQTLAFLVGAAIPVVVLLLARVASDAGLVACKLASVALKGK